MSRARPPENFEIASLRKQQAEIFDPMTPGAGTPWEDRGTHGLVGAFFKTCTMSLTSPAKLMASIRRPETVNDANGFVLGCGILWGVSVVIHALLLIPYYNRQPNTEVDTSPYLIVTAIAAVVAVVGTWLGVKLYNAIDRKLLAQEKQLGALTSPLIFNVNAYALGPSMLAIIPVLGPPLALLWIGINFVVAGYKRLRIRFAGALIDAIIPYVTVLVIAIVLYFVGGFLVKQVVGDPTLETKPAKATSVFGN